MFQKVLLFQILISAAICSRGLRNTVSTTFIKQTTTGTITSEIPVSTRNDKVELTVYYETLCPASVDFFVTQLKPTVKRLTEHLDVHLIPYGHAKTFRSRGRYFFDCQHGRRECFANMVHACAIDVLRNNTHSIFFNSCLMQYISYQSNYDYFVSVVSWCGYTEKVHIAEIWKCVKGLRGNILLKKYGDATHELSPSYVPYLMINGSTQHQDEASSDLLGTVCRILNPKPKACRS
ncbi:unnamed protein product [Arctia plantaginis]|uniref:Gamma-interferon-inducible lysosomal thiol reductase n=1 Tax=Arctia plantaginis TaxID=874455 RepID=A0A8S1A5Q5_ARCPL|nr:unnamed protein product [Arctia plantaginis]